MLYLIYKLIYLKVQIRYDTNGCALRFYQNAYCLNMIALAG